MSEDEPLNGRRPRSTVTQNNVLISPDLTNTGQFSRPVVVTNNIIMFYDLF